MKKLHDTRFPHTGPRQHTTSFQPFQSHAVRARLASDFVQHWPELLLRVPPEGARVHLLTAAPDDKAVSAAVVGKLDRGAQVFRGEHRAAVQIQGPDEDDDRRSWAPRHGLSHRAVDRAVDVATQRVARRPPMSFVLG